MSYSQQIGGGHVATPPPAGPRAPGRSVPLWLWAILGFFGLAGVGAIIKPQPGMQAPATSAGLIAAPSEPPLEAGSHAKPSNSYSRQMFTMDAARRLTTFQALLATSHEQCSQVTAAVLKGSLNSEDYWRVSCADTGDWLIAVSPDSSTRLLSCRQTASLGMNLDCDKVWPDRRHRGRRSHHNA